MSDFYIYHEKMKRILNGDMARETLELAEDQYLLSKLKRAPILDLDSCGFHPDFEPEDRFIIIRDEDLGYVVVWGGKNNINTAFGTYEEAEAFCEVENKHRFLRERGLELDGSKKNQTGDLK